MNKFFKRKIPTPIFLGILLGILIAVLQIIFENSKSHFIQSLCIIFGIVILVTFVAKVRFLWKLSKLTNLIEEENNPYKFIEENEKLLESRNGKLYRDYILINISVGYFDLKDYSKAKETLLLSNKESLFGVNLIVYYIDLFDYLVHLHETEQAIEVWEVHQGKFKSYRNNVKIGEVIRLNEIYYALAKDKKEEAKELYHSAKESIKNKRQSRKLAELDAIFSSNEI